MNCSGSGCLVVGCGQSIRRASVGLCEHQVSATLLLTDLIAVIVLVINREAMKFDHPAAVELTPGDRLRIGVERVRIS